MPTDPVIVGISIAIMVFKQIFGYLMLFSFIGFMGYKFFLSFGGLDVGPLITFMAVIFIILIILAIGRILRDR